MGPAASGRSPTARGRHSFLVGGKFTKTLTVGGPVSLLNVDEATLKVARESGLQLDRVGHRSRSVARPRTRIDYWRPAASRLPRVSG